MQMGIVLLENIKIRKRMARELIFSVLVLNTMVILEMINSMEMVNCFIKMGIDTKDHLKMGSKMASVFTFSVMEIDMRVAGRMIKRMEKEFISMQVVKIDIMETGEIT